MPRIRTIKPDAFLSESLSSVPRGTRWTFAGLWTYADDKGRARDDARLVKAALYPLDDDVTLDDVRHDLDQLHAIGAICRYHVEGRDYLHMPTWEEHQRINRPTPAKSPPCPHHEGGMSGHVLDPDDSLSTHGAVTEPSTWEGKGREGNREGEMEGEAKNAADAAQPPTRSLALVNADRPDVEAICTHLAEAIESTGSKKPAVTQKWRTEARLMLDRDGRTVEEVDGCIRWLFSSTHPDAIWWRAGRVASMPKLRDKFDALRLQAQNTKGGTRQQETDDLFNAAAARMGVTRGGL